MSIVGLLQVPRESARWVCAVAVPASTAPTTSATTSHRMARSLAPCGCVFHRAGLGKSRLGGREARQRDAERRAADVVQAELVAEDDGLRLAAVLAADPELQLRLRRTAALDADSHQVAHAALVERLERVAFQHPVLEIEGEELAFRVVA